MSTALLDASDLGLGDLIESPLKSIGEFVVTGVENDGLGNVGAILRGDMNATAIAEQQPVIATAASPAPAPATPTRRRATSTKQSQRGLLFFDLETIPDYSRIDQFDLEPIPVMPAIDGPESLISAEEFISQTVPDIRAWLTKHNPPQEWIDQVLAAEKAGKNRKGALDEFDGHVKRIAEIAGAADARRKLMACCPEMCKIVAFGWRSFSDKKSESLVVGIDDVTEEMILERFWGIVSGASKVVGFNILGFDLPAVFLRSILLGVAPSRLFDLKPWGGDCVDLMALRFPKGPTPKGHGLKWLAKTMGIPIPAGDVDGSQVEELYNTDPAKVGVYVESDVDLVVDVYERYQGFFL